MHIVRHKMHFFLSDEFQQLKYDDTATCIGNLATLRSWQHFSDNSYNHYDWIVHIKYEIMINALNYCKSTMKLLNKLHNIIMLLWALSISYNGQMYALYVH